MTNIIIDGHSAAIPELYIGKYKMDIVINGKQYLEKSYKSNIIYYPSCHTHINQNTKQIIIIL